jgi:hypothetical protein
MQEKKCPECGGLNGGHSNRRCPLMTLEYAQQEIINVEQKWLKVIATMNRNKDVVFNRLKTLITFFQGKVSMLKAENNKLRKKPQHPGSAGWVKASEYKTHVPCYRPYRRKRKNDDEIEYDYGEIYVTEDDGRIYLDVDNERNYEHQSDEAWKDFEILDESPSKEGVVAAKWVKDALQWAKEAIDFASDRMQCPEPWVETWGNTYMNAMHAIQEAQREVDPNCEAVKATQEAFLESPSKEGNNIRRPTFWNVAEAFKWAAEYRDEIGGQLTLYNDQWTLISEDEDGNENETQDLTPGNVAELYCLQKGFEKKEGNKEREVAFAEWILKHKYYPIEHHQRMWSGASIGSKLFTTEQLHKQYNQQKEGKP